MFTQPFPKCRAYELCMWSFVIALGHFTSEVLVFRTAKLSPGIISPLVVACKCNSDLSAPGSQADPSHRLGI